MHIEYAVSRLQENAAVIQTFLRQLTPDQVVWKPAPEQWSILEVVNHLADEEREDFRSRLDYTLHKPESEWPPIDPEGWATERRYAERDFHESVNRFIEARRQTLDWLSGLQKPDLSAAHQHPKFGNIRAGDLLAAWIEHDLLHIRQILRRQHEMLLEIARPYTVDYAGEW